MTVSPTEATAPHDKLDNMKGILTSPRQVAELSEFIQEMEIDLLSPRESRNGDQYLLLSPGQKQLISVFSPTVVSTLVQINQEISGLSRLERKSFKDRLDNMIRDKAVAYLESLSPAEKLRQETICYKEYTELVDSRKAEMAAETPALVIALNDAFEHIVGKIIQEYDAIDKASEQKDKGI